jgi:prophage regulatory protein
MEVTPMINIILMRMPQVEKACGLKKSAIYQKIKAGEFPTPVKLGTRSIAFRSDEIQIWNITRPKTKADQIHEEAEV